MTFLTEDEKAYLSSYMKKVSRSFTLVAPQVESPLDDYLAVAYLVCRVVDNIEDSEKLNQEKQVCFTQFLKLLNSPHDAHLILHEWEKSDWLGLSSSEIEMMTQEDGLLLWQIYAKIPPAYQAPIRTWASVMAEGMALVTNSDDTSFFSIRHHVRLPLEMAGYNRYCFYVAGTVGRMITELAVIYYEIESDCAVPLLKYSEVCGRALQKTNIVKDFAKDLQRGDCYLPDEWIREVDYSPFALKDVPLWWKRRVLFDVLTELDNSVNYVTTLPETAVGYRKAALLMMLPAYQTLLLAAEQCHALFTPDHAVKISRATMGRCLIKANLLAINNNGIRSYAQEVSSQIRKLIGIDQEFSVIGYTSVSG